LIIGTPTAIHIKTNNKKPAQIPLKKTTYSHKNK
jgi:hypothetical protein